MIDYDYDYVLRSARDLSVLLLGLVALFAGMSLVGRVADRLPVSARFRPWVQRLVPVVGLTLMMSYLVYAALLLVLREPLFSAVLLGLTAIVVLFAWAPIYDLVSGVAVRTGRVCRVGDVISAGDARGRVVELGARVVVVRTQQGDEIVIPYAQLIRTNVRRTQAIPGAFVHAFSIEDGAPSRDFAGFRKVVRDAALRCHWASVLHEPKIERRGDGRVEISVYALDEDHAPDVERAILEALHLHGGPQISGIRPAPKPVLSKPQAG